MTRPTPLPPADAPDDAATDDAPSPLLRGLAFVLAAVPAAGIAVHVAFYVALSPEALKAYVFGVWMKALVFVAFLCLVGNWLHYRRTRMRLDVVSRVLAYLWIISMILLLRATQAAP